MSIMLKEFEQLAQDQCKLERREAIATAIGLVPRQDDLKQVSLSSGAPNLLEDAIVEWQSFKSGLATTSTLMGAGASRERVIEQRYRDDEFCTMFFAGKVAEVEIEDIALRLGGEEHRIKYTQLKQSVGLSAGECNDIQQAYISETKVGPSYYTDCQVKGRYWLQYLADQASPSGIDSKFVYVQTGNDFVEQRLNYAKKRKYDAALRPWGITQPSILNVLVDVEFTHTSAPSIKRNPLVGNGSGTFGPRPIVKYQQAVTNAADLLATQTTRLQVPFLAFFGKGDKVTLFLSLLSHERLEVAVLPQCLSNNISCTVALLHLFRASSIYELGFNPLFEYTFDPEVAVWPECTLGDIVPSRLYFPLYKLPNVVVTSPSLPFARTSPFTRATTILMGKEGDTTLAIKLSFIDELLSGREGRVLEGLWESEPHPDYAPKLLGSFISARNITDGPEAADEKKEEDEAKDFDMVAAMSKPKSPYIKRHLEVYLLSSPPDARRLDQVTNLSTLLSILSQLFNTIADAANRGVVHCDLSFGNVLEASGKLHLIDWECGALANEPDFRLRQITGTLATMSVQGLSNKPIRPQDELESAIYVFCLVLCTGISFEASKHQAVWTDRIVKSFLWTAPSVDIDNLAAIRYTLWTTASVSPTVRLVDFLNLFPQTKSIASLVKALFSLPLMDGKERSVSDLVQLASSAIQSVDVSEVPWPLKVAAASVPDSGGSELRMAKKPRLL